MSDDATVRLWDIGARDPLQHAELPQVGARRLAFSPDGATLYAGDDSGNVEQWAVPDGRRRRRLHDHPNSIDRIAASPDGHMLAVAYEDTPAPEATTAPSGLKATTFL